MTVPRLIDFGLTAPLLTIAAEDAFVEVPGEIPLGRDFAYDPIERDLIFTSGGDLEISDEQNSLVSWLTIAMNTIRSSDICYTPEFGSDLGILIGLGFPSDALSVQIESMLRETLLRHDRIVEVDDVRVGLPLVASEPVSFSAVVVLDDSARIALQGAVGE